LRVALGLGDQELEQRLRPALDLVESLQVVAQCLSADQLLAVVNARRVDAVVVGWSLHRLTDPVLEQLERARLPLVVLVPDPEDGRWGERCATVLPITATPTLIEQSLRVVRRGERMAHRPTRLAPEPVHVKVADRAEPRVQKGRVLALVGGAGSPGRTTVAINLAAMLGASVPTALVELDLDSPAIAAYLDRDPSRNICTLAYAVRDDPHQWEPALAAELQPLGPVSPNSVVLCGPPKREMGTGIEPRFVERLVSELGRRYRYVILDIGSELSGADAAAASQRAALSGASQTLVISGSDLVGLWHARVALDQLEHQHGLDRRQLHLVLNRHEPRYHHSPSEVEWHLGVPLVAVVPADYAAVQKAIAQQRPLACDTSSRAARALWTLADRVHTAKLRQPLAAPPGGASERWWQRLMPGRNTARMRISAAPPLMRTEPRSLDVIAPAEQREQVLT
jgi:Flp pilus assembly CpaE family ATPase